MPKKTPSYRQRSGYDQALVTLTDSQTRQRRDYWLGTFNSPESRERYHRVIAEWEAAGRCLPPPLNDPTAPTSQTTVAEVILAFKTWSEQQLRPIEGNLKVVLRLLNQLYGTSPAEDFGPKKLRFVREAMVRGDLSANPRGILQLLERQQYRCALTGRPLTPETAGMDHNDCGLELSVEKTHVTHVRDGFDFLGFHLNHTVGQSGKRVPKIKVGQKALANVKQRLNDAMRNRPHQESVALRLQRGSAVVRGWSEYFRIAHNFTDLAGTLDHHALWTALQAICRKMDIPTGTAMKRFYRNGGIQANEFCRLETFSGISMKLDYRGPEPYTPGKPGQNTYESDDEMEAAFAQHNERQRLGNMDLKLQTLQRDGSLCRLCGKRVTSLTSQMDHIVPVKRFASYTLASTEGNLQTLCLDCHRQKHGVQRS